MNNKIACFIRKNRINGWLTMRGLQSSATVVITRIRHKGRTLTD